MSAESYIASTFINGRTQAIPKEGDVGQIFQNGTPNGFTVVQKVERVKHPMATHKVWFVVKVT